jgi:hypothetical protein
MASIVQDTFAAIGKTPAWLGNAAHTLFGSRFFVATSALFFVAFLGAVTFADHRFPPITKVSFLSVVGFAPAAPPPPQAPGEISGHVQQAVDAGVPYIQPYVDQARVTVAAYFHTNPDAVVWGNYAGLVLSGLCFIIGLYLLARQETRRH